MWLAGSVCSKRKNAPEARQKAEWKAVGRCWSVPMFHSGLEDLTVPLLPMSLFTALCYALHDLCLWVFYPN